ncbi:MAG: DUF6893 family small protein [Rubrobacteraceae bacterium]|jgi:hypothetical protein
MKKLLFLLALGAGAAVFVQLPEIKRYMNMRNM